MTALSLIATAAISCGRSSVTEVSGPPADTRPSPIECPEGTLPSIDHFDFAPGGYENPTDAQGFYKNLYRLPSNTPFYRADADDSDGEAWLEIEDHEREANFKVSKGDDGDWYPTKPEVCDSDALKAQLDKKV